MLFSCWCGLKRHAKDYQRVCIEYMLVVRAREIVKTRDLFFEDGRHMYERSG